MDRVAAPAGRDASLWTHLLGCRSTFPLGPPAKGLGLGESLPAQWPWVRIAEYSGLAVVVITFLIRLAIAWDDVFEDSGQPLLMVAILVVPCVSLIFIRPFTTSDLSQQQRFALTALLGVAVLSWWAVFGDEWLTNRAYWESGLSWLLDLAITAVAWIVHADVNAYVLALDRDDVLIMDHAIVI